MKYLSLSFSAFGALLVTIILGFIFYSFIDGVRIDAFCPAEFAQEGSCYDPSWPFISEWVCAVTAIFMVLVASAWVIIFQSRNKFQGALFVFVPGVVLAILLGLTFGTVSGPLVTLVLGGALLWSIRHITSVG